MQSTNCTPIPTCSVRQRVVENVSLDQLSAFIRDDRRSHRRPAIVKGADVGECVVKWTTDYLSHSIGERAVSVHVGTSPALDFLNKNFAYRTYTVKELLHRCTAEGTMELQNSSAPRTYLYMRALASENPRHKPADISSDFPELAADVTVEKYLPEHRYFSSVLRIASPGTQLWTHYDVMENILLQVRGRKRVVLFSPLDAPYLYLKGDKSCVLEIEHPDLATYPQFVNAVQFVGTLEAGDILYIPALWFHNVTALDSTNVAVNYFWKDLADAEYDAKDAYGNKDPLSFQRAQQGLSKAIATVRNSLPSTYRQFYAHRMIAAIQESLLSDRNIFE